MKQSAVQGIVEEAALVDIRYPTAMEKKRREGERKKKRGEEL